MTPTSDDDPLRVHYEGGEDGGDAGGGDDTAGGGGQDTATGGGQDTAGGGDQFDPAKFRDFLPEDLRNDTALGKVADLEGLARGYVSAQKFVGVPHDEIVRLPRADDHEARRGVLQRLGLPEKVDDYKIEQPKDVPEHLGLDKPLGKWFVAKAHELGVLPEQAQGIYHGLVGELTTAFKDEEARLDAEAEENVRAIRAEFGPAFDQRLAAANFAADKFGVKQVLNDAGLGAHPAVVKMLSEVGRLVSEDGSGDGSGGGGDFGSTPTPGESKARADELTSKALSMPMGSERKRLIEQAAKMRGGGR